MTILDFDHLNRILQNSPKGTILDYKGAPVYPNQRTYIQWVARQSMGGNFAQVAINPNYDPTWAPDTAVQQEAPPPPQYNISFDTIGQTIPLAIGNCRLALHTIWAQGIEQSGPTSSPTLSFAAALCRPIDQSEEGSVGVIFSQGNAIYDPDKGGVQPPDGISPDDLALLQFSLENAIVYPGDEAQDPCPFIVADKGESRTPGFRGLRYIYFPQWPTSISNGLPNLSLNWVGSKIKKKKPQDAAVEFLAGSD